jgi:hypothetical protein
MPRTSIRRWSSSPGNNAIFDQVSGIKADVRITSEVRRQTKQNPQLCGFGLDPALQ